GHGVRRDPPPLVGRHPPREGHVVDRASGSRRTGPSAPTSVSLWGSPGMAWLSDRIPSRVCAMVNRSLRALLIFSAFTLSACVGPVLSFETFEGKAAGTADPIFSSL